MFTRYDVAIFDGNNLTRRSQFAHADLSVRAAGRPPMLTGVCFGVMKAIEKINTLADRAEIAWDSGRVFRTKLDPNYKGNRRPTDAHDESEEEYQKQLKLTKSMLRCLGFPQISAKGEEADDVISTLVRQYTDDGLKVLIVSTDQDFYQLVRKNVHILASKNGNDTYITKKHLLADTGLKPRQYLDVMSLCGDRGDNVKGVPGIGEKTAIEIVKSQPNFVNCVLAGEPPDWMTPVPAKRVVNLMEKAVEHAEIVKLARKLTRLRTLKSVDIDVGERDLRKLRQQFVMLGFRSLLDPTAWDALTKAEFSDADIPKPTVKSKARAKLASLPKPR